MDIRAGQILQSAIFHGFDGNLYILGRPSEGINLFQSKTTERHQILNYVQEITTMGPKNLNFCFLTLKILT